jgi:hypothetical protein
MATVLEGCNTEEQRSVVSFLWAKGLTAKDMNKEVLSATVGYVSRSKPFTIGSRNSLKDF